MFFDPGLNDRVETWREQLPLRVSRRAGATQQAPTAAAFRELEAVVGGFQAALPISIASACHGREYTPITTWLWVSETELDEVHWMSRIQSSESCALTWQVFRHEPCKPRNPRIPCAPANHHRSSSSAMETEASISPADEKASAEIARVCPCVREKNRATWKQCPSKDCPTWVGCLGETRPSTPARCATSSRCEDRRL